MLTIFTHTLKRFLAPILGWGISFALIAFYLMALYRPMIDQQAEIVAIFDAYGETMMAFFGGGVDFLTPAGFMDFGLFSYAPVMAGIFVVLVGSGLLAADEEKGTLDLIAAHPISRTALFWGRFLAFATATAGILTLTWVGYALGVPLAEWEVSVLALFLPHLSLLALLLLLGALALLLSMLLPSRTLAASAAGALMVVSYLVDSLASVYENLESLNAFLPLNYYQGGWALEGLDWPHFLVLLGAAALLVLLAWLLFLRRDIRVSGEGSWRLPVFGRQARESHRR